jgi:hypothetical protein
MCFLAFGGSASAAIAEFGFRVRTDVPAPFSQYSAEFYVPDSPRTGGNNIDAVVVRIESGFTIIEAGAYWNRPEFPNQWSGHVCYRSQGGVPAFDNCGAGFPLSVNEKLGVLAFPWDAQTVRVSLGSDVGVCSGSCQPPRQEFRFLPTQGTPIIFVGGVVWGNFLTTCDQLPSTSFAQFRNETLYQGGQLITNPAWEEIADGFIGNADCGFSTILRPTIGNILWNPNL